MKNNIVIEEKGTPGMQRGDYIRKWKKSGKDCIINKSNGRKWQKSGEDNNSSKEKEEEEEKEEK